MLRRIRIVLAVLCLVLTTLLFLDFTGALHGLLHYMAKIQLVPAILALNLLVIGAVVLLTLLFGRLYCSIICPLGVFQDVISHQGVKGKRAPFRYAKAKTALRLVVLVVFIAFIALGMGSLMGILEPYGTYGLMVNNLLSPLVQLGNNGLAALAERADSYAFYSVDIWLRSVAGLILALLALGIIGWLSWKHGRAYCNTICPVGTVLGYLSKFALFKFRIDKSKCVRCGQCALNCKAACIDSKNHAIDYSRCVACGNCEKICVHGAIKFTASKPEQKAKAASEKAQKGRREFMSQALLLATAPAAAKAPAPRMKVDGGLAPITPKQPAERQCPVVPAGGMGHKNFYSHCVACQLCISACPNGVLRPSMDLSTFMQPIMSFEKGYCRPECTACSDVCPAGAIHPITKEEKSATSIGHAVWVEKNCIVTKNGTKCGNCAKHCPTGAIQMVQRGELWIPVVNPERCIGCGNCEYVCPAAPMAGIYVEGNSRHRQI
ncbi:MAG: 4Fe-4S binding protein [Akkermansia sp.]